MVKFSVLSRSSDLLCPRCRNINQIGVGICSYCGLRLFEEDNDCCPVCRAPSKYISPVEKNNYICTICFSDLLIADHGDDLAGDIGAVSKYRWPGPPIIISNMLLALLLAPSYMLMMRILGYSYEFHVMYSVFFTISALSILLIFGSRVGVDKIKLGLVALPIVFVTLEELLLNSIYIVYGLTLALAGMVMMPVIAVKWGERYGLRIVLESAALVLATRVVISPFPLGFLGLSAYLPTIYSLILICLLAYIAVRHIPLDSIRLHLGRTPLRSQVMLGIVVGFLLGFVEYLILRPEPLLGSITIQQFLYMLIVFMFFVGLSEELLFRGLLQTSLERMTPKWFAVMASSAVFGLMHLGYLNPAELVFAYGAGVAFGYLAIKTDGLLSPIIAHGLGNVVLHSLGLLP